MTMTRLCDFRARATPSTSSGLIVWQETTETLVHGVCQALQKRGLPRAVMTDNGSAMTADEFRSGLHTLGILHETTLPYSAYQNAKQETLWASDGDVGGGA